MSPLTKMVLVGVGRAAVGQVRPKYQEDHGPRRWHSRKRRERASVWWTLLVAAAATLYGAATDPVATWSNWQAIGGLVVAWLVYIWVYVNRKAEVNRQIKRPLGGALAKYFNDNRYVTSPDQMMRLAIDPASQSSTIYVPEDWNPGTERKELELARLVGQRVGQGATPNYDLTLRGHRPHIKVWPAPAPPDDVLFSDPEVRKLVDEAPDGKPLQGLGPRGVPVSSDLDAEAPHGGYSMATNSGKSTAVKALLAQGLRHGGIALILDRKLESHTWCLKHPAVKHAFSEQEIFDALMWASGEIDRRYELVKEAVLAGRERPAPEELGPRLFLVVEELNALEIDMRRWWQGVKESGDPSMCPALPVLGRFLAMGRAARCHALVVAQKLTCQAIGGTAARENLTTRVIGRGSQSTWNMLAPECKVGGKYPRKSMHRGRVHVVGNGDEAVSCQILYFTDKEAMDYAMSGTVAEFPAREVGAGATSSSGSPGKTAEAGAGVRHLELVSVDEPEPITLAVAAEKLGLTHKIVRNGRDRDPGFPEPVSSGRGVPSLYRFVDIEAWAEMRAVGAGGAAL